MVASDRDKLTFEPLVPDRWDDLVELFGPQRGASSGCWCMWWRLAAKDWQGRQREDRQAAFRAIVKAGPPPGVLAYGDGRAVGWVAVGPRITLPRLNRSRVAAPLDDDLAGVFVINCFYIRAGWRRQGLMEKLIAAAVELAWAQGARRVEACPVEPARPLQWGEGFVGIASAFRAAGFAECARRGPTRPLMGLSVA